jgi:hypothetical protein
MHSNIPDCSVSALLRSFKIISRRKMKVSMKRGGSALHKRVGSKGSRTDDDGAAMIMMVYNSCILYKMYIDIMNLLSHFLL